MRILYASERPPYPLFLGGAARCAHRLLYALTRELGVECAAVGSSDYGVAPWSYPDPAEHAGLGVTAISRDGRSAVVDCGYPVRVIADFHAALSRFIDAFAPDVVWAQLEGARAILELATTKGIEGVFYVHDAEFNHAELRAIAELGSRIVCNSDFLADKVRGVIKRRASVVYPPSELDFGVEAKLDGCLTMINPHRVKGIETFIEIAKRMPSERFLLVESWKLGDQAVADLGNTLTKAPNVRFVRRVSDMRQIYGQTRLLLVPSMWEEGFGMVAVEAQSCGIPVIASERGGLPESVGDGGILIRDYRNVDAWTEAIRGVLKDADTYRVLAVRARRHAGREEFTASVGARRFHEICGAPAPRVLVRALLDAPKAVTRLGKLIRRAAR